MSLIEVIKVLSSKVMTFYFRDGTIVVGGVLYLGHTRMKWGSIQTMMSLWLGALVRV